MHPGSTSSTHHGAIFSTHASECGSLGGAFLRLLGGAHPSERGPISSTHPSECSPLSTHRLKYCAHK